MAGGAGQYVDKIIRGLDDARLRTPVQRIERGARGVAIHTEQGVEYFDEVVLACHSDQALALLARPTQAEAQVLGANR